MGEEEIDHPNSDSKDYIFKDKDFEQQNKNTPRFIVRLAVKYLREYKDDYPEEIYEIVLRECQIL